MKWLFVVLLTVIPLHPAAGLEKKFIDSWKKYDEFLTVFDDKGLQYRNKISLKFDSLPAYSKDVRKPPEIEGEIESVLVLWSQANTTILMATPKNNMKEMTLLNEEYAQALKQCSEDRSWLILLPENEWIEIELNPYCTMHYGEDQILIDLYWADSSKRPFVDIVTNALTCVPHHLYGWDGKSRTYVLKSVKCTGNRFFENYSGSDMPSRQVYPPLGKSTFFLFFSLFSRISERRNPGRQAHAPIPGKSSPCP